MFSEGNGGEGMKNQEILSAIIGSKRARKSKSQMKTMVFIFFGVIPQGQTVTQAYYVELLKRLHEAVHRERLELGPTIVFSTTAISKHPKHIYIPPCPDLLWGPPSLLPNGYQGFFPWG
jgi:hypothetical protein